MLNCILIQRNIFRILLRIFTRKWKRIQKTLGHVVIRKPQFLVILFAGINSILSIAYQKKKNLRSFAKQNTPYRARPI